MSRKRAGRSRRRPESGPPHPGAPRARGPPRGASLALSGTLVQAVTRDPLAEPGVLGVSGGAALGAVLLVTAVPAAVLLGAVLVRTADLPGRTVIAPAQLGAGLMTAAVGTPYFLYLLVRGRRQGR
ncbi:iron chelate uptake ABC transporter family permease subunit [Streptomyces sp. NPDC046859]|uniref:iron chelate uptake ABC transporter family permease subunit n=1 Tax=Streptomyces sp. NPDC046859 TaxID=3155734 RepID=UPI0033C4D5C9